MANKRRGLARTVSGSQLAATARESAQQIWLAGLGAYSRARGQGNRMFKTLAKDGRAVQSLMRKAAEASLRQAAAKAAASRLKVEQVFEVSVARALKRFGVPTREGVQTLSRRVAALTVLIDKLTLEVTRKRTAAKRAASGRH